MKNIPTCLQRLSLDCSHPHSIYADKYLKEDKALTLTELENDLNLPRIKEYDFIVGRLSEQFNVLLLEAGGDPTPASQVPFFVRPVVSNPDINNRWPSIPQRNASLESGGILTSHLGKMLGGSDSHNDMVHNRGSPHDYDNYARILNDSSWTYENVLQYFKKYENFIGELFTGDYDENYGHGGPITIDTDTPPFLPIWFEVARELGYSIGDPNGYQKESFTPMAKAMNKGQRSSAFNQYIKPIMGTRQNLTVLPYSVALQVLIDDNKNAYGVLHERHGIPQIAHATKEVIISSGIFATPLLLMKSGVGPRDQLEAAGIPVKHEQPAVGQNLREHLIFTLNNIQYNSSILPYIPTVPQEENFEDMITKYQETGEGILGYLQEGPEAFVVSSRAKQDGQENWPDLQLVMDQMCPVSDEGDLPVSCMDVFAMRTKMRGTVKLNATEYKSGNENNFPKLAIIDHAVFQGEGATDMDVILDGINTLLEIINSTAMQKLGTVYKQESYPACDGYEFLSREYWTCAVTQRVRVGLHAVGTCSMGTVLDSKFRVQGISNLRVADASVFPEPPDTNLMGPILMMSEKASEDIEQAWL
ncbi:Oxygen-dependent choline dehydrogenase [Orchesella cincta]|uniref:Oxygen-dependent choline dehydrogenase n=1 Tax=Orchesella cincta TaxID=48709 RepID=A0A1D2MKQ4_ORCCI|nr:Oxygen-dependent choline dehydrogenase [Orchesella cincta]